MQRKCPFGQPSKPSFVQGWHDKFWGICICTKCANKGENHLGKILMEVREELKLSNQKPSIEDIIKDKNKLD